MNTTPLVFERTFKAPIAKVWTAITSLEEMKQWYFPMLAAFKPEAGFETAFTVEHKGNSFEHIWKVAEVVPGTKISYEWRYGGFPGNSLVTFELFAEGEQTRLVLTHSKLESFQGDIHPGLAKENFAQGWTSFVDTKLKNYLEQSTVASV